MLKQNYKTDKGFNIRLEARLKNAGLVEAREELGLTAKKFAELVNISYGAYKHYENMISYPPKEAQNKILKFYKEIGINLTKEKIFPKELQLFRPKKYINTRIIPTEKLISLSTLDQKLLPPYTSNTSEDMQNKEELDLLLDILSDREKKIIEMRFGLKGEPKSLGQAGNVIGISRERVRQIERAAIRKLKNYTKTLIKENKISHQIRDFNNTYIY